MNASVTITQVRKFKNARDEWWYRFQGTVNGHLVRDTIELDAPTVEGLGMEQAMEKAKRQLLGLQRWFDESDADPR